MDRDDGVRTFYFVQMHIVKIIASPLLLLYPYVSFVQVKILLQRPVYYGCIADWTGQTNEQSRVRYYATWRRDSNVEEERDGRRTIGDSHGKRFQIASSRAETD